MWERGMGDSGPWLALLCWVLPVFLVWLVAEPQRREWAQGGFCRRLLGPGLGVGLSISSCLSSFCEVLSGAWSWWTRLC